MCRNHSHATGVLMEVRSEEHGVLAVMLTTQPLTLESLTGERLTLPAYSALYVLQDNVTRSLASLALEMVGQGAAVSSKDETPPTSGPITPTK